MDQFLGLIILGLIIWFIYMMRTRNKVRSTSASVTKQNTSQGSNLNIDGENITVTLVGSRGQVRVSNFSVFDIDSINLMKPTSRKNGVIQFVLKSGLTTEPLEILSRNSAVLDQVIAEIERILESDSEDGFGSPPSENSSGKPSVQFDGRLRTTELEYLSIDESNPYEQAIIQIDEPEFAVVDLETTGLYPDGGDRIVEIAIVVMNSRGEVLSDWSSMINPGRKISATKVHGLTDQDVANSPNFSEVAAKVNELLANRIFVAHNASFDYRFVRRELGTSGIDLDPARFPVFDTMSLATRTFPNIPNKKMESLLSEMQLDLSSLPGRGAHSALTDAHAGAQVLSLYLRNGRQQVLDSVNWPLLQTWTKPKILSTAEVLEMDRLKNAEDEFMASLVTNPPELIEIQKFTEVYFTGFMPEQEVLINKFTKEWEVVRALRVTKKKCVLVVTAETGRASGAVKSAMKWDIPVVALEHVSRVSIVD